MGTGFWHAHRLMYYQRFNRCINHCYAIAGVYGMHAKRYIGHRENCEILPIFVGLRWHWIGGQLTNGTVIALVLIQLVTKFWIAQTIIFTAVHVATIVTRCVVHFKAAAQVIEKGKVKYAYEMSEKCKRFCGK